MKTRKKLLSFLLVLTLIMTSLPAQLFATEAVDIPINLQNDILDDNEDFDEDGHTIWFIWCRK